MVQFDSVYAYEDLELDAMGPYIEGGLHRPDPAVMNGTSGIVSSLVDFWSLVTPRPGEEYSVMELPTPGIKPNAPYYDEAMTTPIRFLAVKVGDNRLPDYLQWIYGWVDDIKVKIQKGQNRTIVVRWHPDWFLTMGTTASYGAGRILRGPQSLARPDDTPPRMWVCDGHLALKAYQDHKNIIVNLHSVDYQFTGDPWVVVAYTKNIELAGKTFTIIDYITWQPGISIPKLGESGDWPTVPWGNMYSGALEEYLGIDPVSIIGVWVCPFRPFNNVSQVSSNEGYGYWHDISLTPCVHSITFSGQTLSTTDDKKYMVTDEEGAVVGNLGWGMEFDQVTMSVDIGTSGSNVVLRFKKPGHHGAAVLGEDRTITIPMRNVPITDNAKSSYVYSGERDYDIAVKRIQQDQAAVNGIANIGTSAIGGAIAGTLAGGPAGTAAGAIAGIVSGAVGVGVGYASTGHYDRKTQEAVDKLKSQQTANLIVSAQGPSWYLVPDVFTGRIELVSMVRDSVSAGEISAEHSELGYRTDSYVTNCASLITDARTNGGGLKIEGLEVFGVNSGPARYIAELFARGVHIDKVPL